MTDIIRLENVEYKYQEGTPFEYHALHDVNVAIRKGEMAGIIGPTGSGKSTLVQHFNGLLKPASGKVLVDGKDINAKEQKKAPSICFEVGLVFQYPEYQLFEETVYDDVAFGPKNMDLSEEEIGERVRKAMQWLSLDYEKMKDRSPFSLSGGEMRRVALAGVLAMEPKVLVLDEPTAGLDPRGREELRSIIKRFHDEMGMTLVMVTHEMGEIARMVDHLIVVSGGEIAADSHPREIFKKADWLKEMGLGAPPYMELMKKLKQRGINVRQDVLGMKEAAGEILKHICN